ncbi:hypothetical protein HMPREF1529_02694 [Microbacterium sp. oral taxon 186 str. F0373]|uniref:helix-turn-helix domain-containing protein n=1 Tax=unclassified Microbacterium TaxID=2609290 RepID=UPI00034E356A|nr:MULTISPECIES: helix-turn-helix transcriptional regulator [unclassified Microbacterium]EPD83318.1 hypothetical protein HMPREF1529_02694 [Microbacterium sp. oral taxon 186 str. F0373]RKS84824.1 helix-turn-helix protein [Microbacterium sp. AG790]
MNDSDKHVADAVRAELARQRIKTPHVADALGVSRPTLYSRLAGKSSFTIRELDRIADVIGVDTLRLIESAILGKRIGDPIETQETEPEPPLQHDPFAQPPRARRHNGRAY